MLSENVKNWVTAISIVVGGFWAFFEWNTLLPKTDAEIQKEIAELRTRTTGTLDVAIFSLVDGEEPTTKDGRGWYDICGGENPPAKVFVKLPVRAQLALQSSSPLPAIVEVTDFLVSELESEGGELVVGRSNLAFSAPFVREIQESPIPEGGFLGGLNWTTVEPNGRSEVAVFGHVNIPFTCSPSTWVQTEVALGLKIRLTGVLTDETMQPENPIFRYFLQTCTINPTGHSTCANQRSEDERQHSDLKVIAQ